MTDQINDAEAQEQYRQNAARLAEERASRNDPIEQAAIGISKDPVIIIDPDKVTNLETLKEILEEQAPGITSLHRDADLKGYLKELKPGGEAAPPFAKANIGGIGGAYCVISTGGETWDSKKEIIAGMTGLDKLYPEVENVGDLIRDDLPGTDADAVSYIIRHEQEHCNQEAKIAAPAAPFADHLADLIDEAHSDEAGDHLMEERGADGVPGLMDDVRNLGYLTNSFSHATGLLAGDLDRQLTEDYKIAADANFGYLEDALDHAYPERIASRGEFDGYVYVESRHDTVDDYTTDQKVLAVEQALKAGVYAHSPAAEEMLSNMVDGYKALIKPVDQRQEHSQQEDTHIEPTAADLDEAEVMVSGQGAVLESQSSVVAHEACTIVEGPQEKNDCVVVPT